VGRPFRAHYSADASWIDDLVLDRSTPADIAAAIAAPGFPGTVDEQEVVVLAAGGGDHAPGGLQAECGFDLAGVAAAEPTIEALFYPQWLAKGYAGEMDYLKGRRGEMRADPKALLPTAKSLVCLGLIYNTDAPFTGAVDAARDGG